MRNLLTMLIAAGTTLAITNCIRRASEEAGSADTAKAGSTLPPPIPSPVATGADSLAAANRLGPTAVI